MALKPLIIGICGGSASGKTTLACDLAEALGSRKTNHIAIDNYYHDFVKLGRDPATVNYDHPDSIDLIRLAKDLEQLCTGSSIKMPVYDYTTHTRTNAGHFLTNKKFVLVEGLFLFNIPLIAHFFSVKVFIDTPEKIRLERRIARDTRERNRSPESVMKQYMEFVFPMHNTYVQPNCELADLIIDGNRTFSEQITDIVDLIRLQSAL